MFRFVVTFCLLSLLLCSVGCQTCHSPHDYRIAGYIDRCDDYRGFNPMYRAGSILSGGWDDTTVFEDALYEGTVGDFYCNAGNYGVTTPISTMRRVPSSSTIETRPGQSPSPIAIPQQNPEDRIMIEPRIRESNGSLPTVDELLNQPRGTMPIPVTPPTRQRMTPPSFDDTHIESIPFSPSDEITVPPSPFPTIMETDPPITLEELRRLDPSIHDVQIISIEDAVPETLIR
jgi:hypothetical protein